MDRSFDVAPDSDESLSTEQLDCIQMLRMKKARFLSAYLTNHPDVSKISVQRVPRLRALPPNKREVVHQNNEHRPDQGERNFLYVHGLIFLPQATDRRQSTLGEAVSWRQRSRPPAIVRRL